MFGNQKKFPSDDPLMGRDEALYRERRLVYILQAMDSWVIEKVNVTLGMGSPSTLKYIAYPQWDEEALLTRETFNTYDEALAEVRRHNGKLLTEISQ